MNEIVQTNKKKFKKHASFLKIYIQTESFKLNVIPIPLWFARGTLMFSLNILKIVSHFMKKDISNMSNVDINEILDTSKTVLKEIRHYPPFSIVEIESHDTKISIRTK